MIKLYGEAKSATKYVEELIAMNTDAELAPNGSPWKHGFPEPGDYDCVFLMRDAYEWIKSYLADPSDSRFRGLYAPFGEDWNNILECRTAKYKAYMEYLDTRGGLLLKTEHVKYNPGAIRHLKAFGYEVDRPVEDIPSHMRLDVDGKDNPNRKPLTDEQRDFIQRNINDEIEATLNSLTVEVWL